MQLVLVSIQLIGFFSACVESLSHGATQGASKAASHFSSELFNLMDTNYKYDKSNDYHILDFSPWFTAKCGYQDDSRKGTTSDLRVAAHQIMCDIEHDNQTVGYLKAISDITSWQGSNVDFMKLGFSLNIKNKLLTGYKFKLNSHVKIEKKSTVPFKFEVGGKVGDDRVKFTQEIRVSALKYLNYSKVSKTHFTVSIKSDVSDYENLRPSWKKFVVPDGSCQIVIKEEHYISRSEQKCENPCWAPESCPVIDKPNEEFNSTFHDLSPWKFEGLKFIGIPVISIPKCDRTIFIDGVKLGSRNNNWLDHNGESIIPLWSAWNYRGAPHWQSTKENKIHFYVTTPGREEIDVTVRL